MFRKKTPKIQYQSFYEEYREVLVPSIREIPQWYKDIPGYSLLDKSFDFNTNDFKHNVKSCMPFFDTLATGYLVKLPMDINVEIKDGQQNIAWRNLDAKIIDIRAEDTSIPIPSGYSSNKLIWSFPLALSIPRGYSMLVTHPLNRFDLPFITLSGIVDGGLTMAANGQLPFFLKEGFEGVIQKDTPIAQVIPFKLGNWESEEKIGLVKEGYLETRRSLSQMIGWYKKTYWVKKQFK